MDEYARKRYIRDIDYFSKKLEADSESRLFMPLAFAYLNLGKYDEVISLCEKGLDAHNDYHAAKVLLAEAYMSKGFVDEAKWLLKDVAKAIPDNYRANRLMGDIYRSEDNFEKALYYYRTASLKSPEDNSLKSLIEELANTKGLKPIDTDTFGDDIFSSSISEASDSEMADLSKELTDIDITNIEIPDKGIKSDNKFTTINIENDNLQENLNSFLDSFKEIEIPDDNISSANIELNKILEDSNLHNNNLFSLDEDFPIDLNLSDEKISQTVSDNSSKIELEMERNKIDDVLLKNIDSNIIEEKNIDDSPLDLDIPFNLVTEEQTTDNDEFTLDFDKSKNDEEEEFTLDFEEKTSVGDLSLDNIVPIVDDTVTVKNDSRNIDFDLELSDMDSFVDSSITAPLTTAAVANAAVDMFIKPEPIGISITNSNTEISDKSFEDIFNEKLDTISPSIITKNVQVDSQENIKNQDVNLSKETDYKTEKVVKELEKWLTNIEKIKEERNVL